MNTDNTSNSISGVTGYVSGFFNKIGEALKPKEQPSGEQPPQTGYAGYGGARSRRRKCNKKHRHTKSCRKYVKKGRKTRKH